MCRESDQIAMFALHEDLVIALDADNTHPPELMPGMVKRAEAGADIVIASRYQPGAEIHGLDAKRSILFAN